MDNSRFKFRVWFHGINLMGQVTNLKGSNDGFVFDGVVAECWPDGRQKFYEAYKNFELMQYTGLKDKNGKEIYESDKIIDASGNEWTITFSNGCFRVDNGMPLGSITVDIEVIGNIYEGR